MKEICERHVTKRGNDAIEAVAERALNVRNFKQFHVLTLFINVAAQWPLCVDVVFHNRFDSV